MKSQIYSNSIILALSYFFWKFFNGSSTNRILGWDDTELVRLSSCFSSAYWSHKDFFPQSCWSAQWRSPILQAFLGITPNVSDPVVYANGVATTYSLLLLILICGFGFYLASFVDQVVSKILLVSLIMVTMGLTGLDFFQNNLQVDSVFIFLFIIKVLACIKVINNASNSHMHLFLAGCIFPILLLLKLTAVILAPLFLYACIKNFREIRRPSSLVLLASSFLIPLVFFSLYPVSLRVAYAATAGEMSDYYGNLNGSLWERSQLALEPYYKGILFLFLWYGIAQVYKRSLVNIRSAEGLILILGILSIIPVLTRPIVDSHYIAPLMYTVFTLSALNTFKLNSSRQDRDRATRINYKESFFQAISVATLSLLVFVSYQIEYKGLEDAQQITNKMKGLENVVLCTLSDSPNFNLQKLLYLAEKNKSELKFSSRSLADDELNGYTTQETASRYKECDFIAFEEEVGVSISPKNKGMKDLISNSEVSFKDLNDCEGVCLKQNISKSRT